MRKKLSVFMLTFIMAFSGICAFNAFSDTAIVAQAASLSAPSVKAKSASYNSVKISWKKVGSAKKYIVYRSTKKSSGYKAVKTINKNSTVSYTDKKLTCGKTYYYKVKAVNGKKSKLSKAVSAKPALAKASGVAVKSATCTKVTFKYNKVAGATGYQIYYSTSKNGSYKKIATTKNTSYTHSLAAGKTGYYKVRAYKTVGKSTVYGAFSAVTAMSAKQHAYGSYRVSVAPTCVKEGKKHKTCQSCGKKEYAVMEATYEHSYSAYKQTKAATCTQDGILSSTCSVCKKTRTKIIKKTGHTLTTTTVNPTCIQVGTITTACANCDYSTVVNIPMVDHNYEMTKMAPTCTDDGCDLYQCTMCGDSYRENIVESMGGEHSFATKTYEPTCKVDGYTVEECIYCHTQKEETKEVTVTTPYTEHIRQGSYVVKEDGYRYYNCPRCGNDYKEKTCYIDLSQLPNGDWASYADTAVYDSAKGRITLKGTADVDSFEITGSAENLTIVVNADVDTDIKLNNAQIINGITASGEEGAQSSQDCFKLNSTSTTLKQSKDDLGNPLFDTEGNPIMEIDDADISISAKDGTVNTLRVSAKGGNAIEAHTKLELKGHGVLNMDTVSTSIDSRAKITLKNLTLNITTQNRGIDTKEDVPRLDVDGNPSFDVNGNQLYKSEYYNIEIGSNANITINSTDDGIRGKNITFNAPDATLNEVDTILVINSEIGDGIQAEGGKGVIISGGDITIKAAKYAFNCLDTSITIAPTAKVNTDGSSAYSK